jgi:hypothetical protein
MSKIECELKKIILNLPVKLSNKNIMKFKWLYVCDDKAVSVCLATFCW